LTDIIYNRKKYETGWKIYYIIYSSIIDLIYIICEPYIILKKKKKKRKK